MGFLAVCSYARPRESLGAGIAQNAAENAKPLSCSPTTVSLRLLFVYISLVSLSLLPCSQANFHFLLHNPAWSDSGRSSSSSPLLQEAFFDPDVLVCRVP